MAATLRVLYVFVALEMGSRRLVHFNLAWPCRPPINNENEHQSQPLVCAKWRYWGAQKIFRNNATEHPTAEWTLQQLREALPGDQDYKFLLHDRHKTFSAGLDEEIERWGLEVLKSPPQAPTANAFCERLIGTIRRECLDYVIPLNESHLKRTLREWSNHYNSGRPHQSLGPGIPDQAGQTLPAEDKPMPANRRVIAKSILGGLHHEYRWAAAA